MDIYIIIVQIYITHISEILILLQRCLIETKLLQLYDIYYHERVQS